VRFEPNATATVHDDANGPRPGLGCLGTSRDVYCVQLGSHCISCTANIALGDGNDALSLAGRSQKGPFTRRDRRPAEPDDAQRHPARCAPAADRHLREDAATKR